MTPLGYVVVPVEFTECRHLKSAVKALADKLLLLNPAWASAAALPARDAPFVDDRGPQGPNALRIAGTIIHPSQSRELATD